MTRYLSFLASCCAATASLSISALASFSLLMVVSIVTGSDDVVAISFLGLGGPEGAGEGDGVLYSELVSSVIVRLGCILKLRSIG